MNSREAGWIGYAKGGNGKVGIADLGDRILFLGRGAGELASLFCFANAEAGAKTLVLDLDDSVSAEVHGYFQVVDYRSLLYDAFKIEGEDAFHAQLISAAYAAALGLSTEDEAVLSSALHAMSAQEDMATPSSLFNSLGGVEGFRGFYVDRLRGRIGALRMMEATRDRVLATLLEGGCIVRFGVAPYPLAAELATALVIAKLLALLRSSSASPDALLVTGAHRLFRSADRMRPTTRLLTHLLDARLSLALASPLPALVDEALSASMVVRVYSSEAWNSVRRAGDAAPASRSYVICDDRSSTSNAFFPRFVRATPRARDEGLLSAATTIPRLTSAILGEVARFSTPTRQSMVAYLSPQFLPTDVAAEIDRLLAEGFLVEELRGSESGSRVFAYALTGKGRHLAEELGA